ncbi:hypothetical protein DICSQDRAFT_138224, partial [Dichomitus squalens LYAD-421 SS1]
CRPPTPPLAPSTPINVPHGMFKFNQYASDVYTVPAYGSNTPYVPAGQNSASTSSASSVPWTPRTAAAPVFTLAQHDKRKVPLVHPQRCTCTRPGNVVPKAAVLLFACTRAFSAKRALLEDLCSADMMGRCMKASQYSFSRTILEISLW